MQCDRFIFKMANIQKSSFRKRVDSKTNPIKGTSASLYNSQLLVSSGISSFDNVIGGGIPVGSLVLINEDEFGTYATSMLKYFLAEGVVSQHALYVCSEDINPEKMVKDLPHPVDAELEDEIENAEPGKKMTIAWRYENLKPSSILDKIKYFGHYYDLSKKMDDKFLKNVHVTYHSKNNVNSGESFEHTSYYYLLQCLKAKLEKSLSFSNQINSERNIIRIGLHHMGSPWWKYDINEAVNESYFINFIFYLRALLRNAYATCMITIPFSKLKKDFMDKCIHFADVAVLLQSFAGTECENVAPYKDYNGIFVIQKLAPINCLVAYNPHATNLAFKIKRKKFVIEEFSLPPEPEDTTQRGQNNSSALSCSAFGFSEIDF